VRAPREVDGVAEVSTRLRRYLRFCIHNYLLSELTRMLSCKPWPITPFSWPGHEECHRCPSRLRRKALL
jgi:hypothetical protein